MNVRGRSRLAPPRHGLIRLILALSAVSIGGCSLLFVQKGSTRLSSREAAPIPSAPSLAAQMSGKETVEYTVTVGDTLASVAGAFYGDSKKAGTIAKANGLRTGAVLKPGRVLKIPPGKYQVPVVTPSIPGPSAAPGNAPTPVLRKVVKRVGGQAYEIEVSGARKAPRPKVNRAFAVGERLRFEIRYFAVVGGYATLSVEALETYNQRPCYRLTAEASSAFPFSNFFKVEDRIVSLFDAVDYFPWRFEKKLREGGYRENTWTEYRQGEHRAVRHKNKNPEQVFAIPPFVQDILSTFYYYRLLDFAPGDRLAIPTQADSKNYDLVVEVLGREKLKVKAGRFDCFLLRPHVKYDNVFQNKGDILLWVTADERRVPVLIRTKIVIGSIDIELLEAELPRLGT